MNSLFVSYFQTCYELFYYKLFSNTIAMRRKDTILGSIYARMMKWEKIVNVKDGDYDLMLLSSYAKILINEKNSWLKWYGSNFSGKTVIDIGAGCGETASFFFNHCASKVIAFEINQEAVSMLRQNASKNHWNIVIHDRKFDLHDLDQPHDYFKMDIEGGEIVLLNYQGKLGKCSMELHPEIIGKENVQKLIRHLSLQPIMTPRVYGIS